MKTTTHSGRTFRSLGVGPNSSPLWEPDEFIARHRFTTEQAETIRAANPGGIEEASEYSDIGGLPADFPNAKYVIPQ